MGRQQVTVGMPQLEQMLAQLEAQAEPAAKAGLYEGAKVLADEINAQIDALQTSHFHFVQEGGTPRKPSPEEKAVLQSSGSAGIAKFEGNGAEINTIVGLKGGYADMQVFGGGTKSVPVALIANSIEHGTSFMQKQPFARKAVSRCKSKLTSAIQAEVEKRFNQIIGEE